MEKCELTNHGEVSKSGYMPCSFSSSHVKFPITVSSDKVKDVLPTPIDWTTFSAANYYSYHFGLVRSSLPGFFWSF